MIVTVCNKERSAILYTQLNPIGEYVVINGHKLHIYRTGRQDKPKLIFMSGSATISPVYDFKILYSKLVEHYRIIVIEKFGYGYSELYDGCGDIDSITACQREALDRLHETGPYVLLPHSMSGLEALRWKQMYPDEIQAIIGLDMALPIQYISWGKEGLEKRVNQMIFLQKLHRKGLLFWYPLNKRGLNKDEISQQRLLWSRNAFNNCLIHNARAVLDNAVKVEEAEWIESPLLLFVSNGKQVSEHWIEYQYAFAQKTHAKVIPLQCGHYIHYYESDRICQEINDFMSSGAVQNARKDGMI